MGEFGRGDEIEVDVAPDRRAAGLPGADRHPGLTPPAPAPAGAGASTSHPVLMQRFRLFRAAVALLLGGPAALAAQEPQADQTAPPIVDSIAVEGNSRLSYSQILGTAGLVAPPAGQLPRHPARHHHPVPHRPVRRRAGGAAERRRPARPGAQGEGAAGARAVGGARRRPAVRGLGQGAGQAGRGAAARPQRGGAVPGLDRLAVQGSRLLRRRGQDAGAAAGRPARSGWCSTSTRAAGSPSAR